jgi:O-antigen ligase
VALAGAGVAVLLARPHWALYALAVSVPYQSLVDFKLGDVRISATEGVVVLLAIGWLTRLAAGRARWPGISPLSLALAILLTALTLSVVVATNLALSAKELLKWIELAAVYLIGASLLDTPPRRRTLMAWLLVAATSQAAVGLVQSVWHLGPAHFMIGGALMRAYGTFEQPNPFGGYLGLHLPLVVALMLFGLGGAAQRRWRIAAGVAALAIGLALFITLSRGAWVGQIVALLLVVCAGSLAARHAVITFGALGLLALAGLWPLLPPEFSGRLVSIAANAVDFTELQNATITPDNWAVLERVSQWYAGWQMFLANPILGVGVGNYNAAYDDYRLDQWPLALGHAHNHYLTVAAEAGMLGLAAYVGVLGAGFVTARRAWVGAVRRGDLLERAMAIGVVGSLAAFATHNLFDVLFVHGMGVTVGLLLALTATVPEPIARRRPPANATAHNGARVARYTHRLGTVRARDAERSEVPQSGHTIAVRRFGIPTGGARDHADE